MLGGRRLHLLNRTILQILQVSRLSHSSIPQTLNPYIISLNPKNAKAVNPKALKP